MIAQRDQLVLPLQLSQVRARTGREHVSGMAKVVEVDRWQPGSLERGHPDPAAEVAVPQRVAAGTGEHEPVIPGRGMGHDVRSARSGMITSGMATARWPAA